MSMKVFASGMNYGAVTPSDATVLDFQALYVGVAGDVALAAGETGSAVTFTGVTAGAILPVKGKRVMSTNTTATNIVWLNG